MRKLGRYELVDRLGRGGMGEVWRARDPALRRDVAVKVLRREGEDGATLREDFVQRFLREARLAASLKHPNVVAIHDVGVDEEPYIVMEYVEGASLRGFIGDASVRVEQRIAWLVEIARALAAAHEIGLVHRDIKPDNVMITKDGHAKVLDFGIAKAIGTADDAPAPSRDAPESFRTQQGRIVGTPKYMAPEQLRGDAIDARVDQWAWACVAYELLTGSMPDRDETAQPISLTVPEVPFDVAAAIVRARSHDPEKRFDTMRALLATFAAQSSGEIATVSVAPRRNPDAPTTTGPMRRSWRRAALVALSSFALAASVVFALRRTKSRAVVDPTPPAPAPACTFAPLAPVALGPLPNHYFAQLQPIVGGMIVGMFRSDEGVTNEQLVTITPSEVTSRLPPRPTMLQGSPVGMFVLSAPSDARHYSVIPSGDDDVVIGRTVSSDALVDVSRVIPVDGFRPVNIVGFYLPRFKESPLAFIVTGHERTGLVDHTALRLYGHMFIGAKIFEGDLDDDNPRSIVVTTGATHVGYTFTASNKLYVGSFEVTERFEDRNEEFGVTARVDAAIVGDARAPRALGETASQGARAFDGDVLHVVWPELGAARLHHVEIATNDADAGAPDETFDVPTNGSTPALAIHDHVYALAWHDGARVYFGEGDSVRRAASRAASLPDTTISAGPWIAGTPSGALVAWMSGTTNEIRRVIVTCR